MSSDESWERLDRRTVYDTKFMTLWEDKVKLPNGHVMDDFSVAYLPEGVLTLATDEHNSVLVLEEYKYATDETYLTFIAGGMAKDESAIDVAKRELLEETGYTTDDFEVISILDVYPSKLVHRSTTVRARNIKKVAEPKHEPGEVISNIRLISMDELKQRYHAGEFKTTYLVAAIATTFPEIISK